MKKIISVALVLTLSLVAITGCGSKNGSNNNKKTYKIGVIQYVQHDALDKSNEGFFDALKDNDIEYDADQQNAAGEASSCQTIAETLVNNSNDLIFAIATPAAQAVAGVTEDIPIVVTAVTDPADAGLVDSNDNPGTNVTGTSDLTPVNEQISLIKDFLPDAKKIGILYCSAESNSVLQAEMAAKACKENDLESEEYTISSTNEIQTVVESMVGKVDAIYSPTDNMVAAGMSTVSQVATENNIPVFPGEAGMTENGGLATYAIDYYKLGYQAGLMAVKILRDGENPKDMPIEYQDKEECALTINEDIAKELKIDISSFTDANIVNTPSSNKEEE